MHGGLPDRIEPALLAERGAHLEGCVALARMERLVSMLATEPGEARVELQFGIDARGLRTVHGRIRAEVALACQRCLQPVACPVDSEFRLAVVASETEERRLPDGVEPLDCSDGPIDTARLVEDEILLGLPLIASHPDAGCNDRLARWQEQEGAAADNPFSVLQDWKDKRRND